MECYDSHDNYGDNDNYDDHDNYAEHEIMKTASHRWLGDGASSSTHSRTCFQSRCDHLDNRKKNMTFVIIMMMRMMINLTFIQCNHAGENNVLSPNAKDYLDQVSAGCCSRRS